MAGATASQFDKFNYNFQYLRRYARMLLGSQAEGDKYVEMTAAHFQSLHAPEPVGKITDFKYFHSILSDHKPDGPDLKTCANILNFVEGFNPDQITEILALPKNDNITLIPDLDGNVPTPRPGKIMLIEDEAIIAMDLCALLTEMGYDILAVARTRAEAFHLAKTVAVDLIISDIQLADQSSGVDAISDILTEMGDVPVIFVTGYPEKLLTGKTIEPAFVLGKPYDEDQIRVTIDHVLKTQAGI